MVIGQPLTMQIFVAIRQEVSGISDQKFVLPEIVRQNSPNRLRSATP